jgi:hypothetical protein
MKNTAITIRAGVRKRYGVIENFFNLGDLHLSSPPPTILGGGGLK